MNNQSKPSANIAIIGMGCRFPGNVTTPEQYWELLKNRVDAIENIPDERWDFRQFYDPEKNTKGKMYTRQGGFLKDVDRFDNVFFRISPLETESLDPQVRIMLELSYEAFESAGIDTGKLRGSATGVFIGLTIVDYIEKDIRSNNPSSINAYSVTGTQMSSASGRISFAFGLEGPSISLDTACSSSLTSVHLACQSLLSGDSDLALAGGVNLILSPKYHVAFCELNALSDDCRSKAFDASANGFVRSEGAGLVVLKRLEDARRDNDHVLAIIGGTGITNDGTSKGYTVPRMEAQAKSIRMAMEMANVGPDDIDYYETHGTGTPVGDPIEMEGIVSVFKNRKSTRKLYAGSAKTNIGHCESAAGIAGLIKSVLALRHNLIPANLHFNVPNPGIDWNNIPVMVPTQAVEWLPSDKPRYASVSAFGLSGTNVNVILREGEPPVRAEDTQTASKELFMLPVSAATSPALNKLAIAYIDLLKDSRGDEWKRICIGAARHRSHFGCRYIASGTSCGQIISDLETWLMHEQGISGNVADKKIVFVFPGQGSQWIGMGKDLLEKEEVFRTKMIECETALSRFADWLLIKEINKGPANNRFREVDVIQPALFAIEVSLACLWQSWGIMPDVVLGHSMGEVAAAHVAGVLSLEDAAKIICRRSALAKTTSGEGAMALTELSYDEALKVIEGYEETVAIGACNGPRSTVLSGDANHIDRILAGLNGRGIFNRLIKVDYASHSPQMDRLKGALLEQLEGIRPRHGVLPVYSTVANAPMNGEAMDALYWSDNLRKPVLFSQAVEKLLHENDSLFIEVSPHPILVQLIDQAIEHWNKISSSVVFSTKRDSAERDDMVNNFKRAYQDGAPVDWAMYYGNAMVTHDKLPAYPWQKDRFWIDQTQSVSVMKGLEGIHPFLYKETRFADDKKVILWEGVLDTNAHRYLEDHKVKNTILFPAAGYVELILASVQKSYGDGRHTLSNITYLQPLILDAKPRSIQIIFKKQRSGSLFFEIYSAAEEQSAAALWELHCNGEVLLFSDFRHFPVQHGFHPSAYTTHIGKQDHYNLMSSVGIQYGERFQGVKEIWVKDRDVLGRIEMPVKIRDFISSYQVHPAVLDACFQVSVASMKSDENTGEAYLPYSIGSFQNMPGAISGHDLWVHIADADLHEPSSDTCARHITVCDENHNPVIVIRDFKFRKLKEKPENSLHDSFYEIKWKKVKFDLTRSSAAGGLVIFDNEGSHQAISGVAENQKLRVARVLRGTGYTIGEGNVMQIRLQPDSKDQFVRLLKDLQERNYHYTEVLFCWGNQVDTLDSYERERADLALVYFIQALNEVPPVNLKKLVVVTSRAQQVLEKEQVNPFQGPVTGVARVAAHEHAEFSCTRADLHAGTIAEAKLLIDLLLSDFAEREFAIRGNEIFVPRFERLDVPAVTSRSHALKMKINATDATAYRFVTREPGILDNITAVEAAREKPLSDEIEVEVKAVGLNFMNVMSALGIYPGYKNGFLCLGIEFSGIVKTVGADVTDLKPGDRVIGLSPLHDCFGKYTICKSLQAVKIPDALDFTDAATLAVAYGTAYACLIAHGNLKKGERILIHSATGGVGLAAIQIAQHVGAEIYATAGTEEKRSLLRKMGVKYVMDSHSLDFAVQVRQFTNGEGIDMVLNSLAGEAMYQSMKLLRGFGRFLEIGKKDIYENSNLKMEIFKQSISYTFFDLHKMLNERPDLVQGHLSAVMDHFNRGNFRPIPKTVFDILHVHDGFDLMTRGQHVGKIVFDMKADGLKIEPEARLFSDQETYLITGGLGGLGFRLMEWMCSKGAAHIVLTGRNKPGAVQQKVIEKLQAENKNITVFTCDVSQPSAVDAMLATVRSSMPALKGIFHAAGSLSDSSLVNLDKESYQVPLAAKIYGAWNLHQATVNDNLKYFVLFSSVASSLGSIGQANYAAGNVFMDALSRQRQAMNKPVTCMNWGPVAEIGLAAQDEIRGQRLAQEGISSLSQQEYTDALEFVLCNSLTDINILHLNYSRWVDNNPTYAIDLLLSNLAGEKELIGENSFVQELRNSASAEQATEMMVSAMKEILASILKSSPDKIDIDLPFVNLGLDSLMAIQLRNKLQKLTGLPVSVTVFWNYSKIRILSDYFLKELGITKAVHESGDADEKTTGELIENMSDHELVNALDHELKDISGKD